MAEGAGGRSTGQARRVSDVLHDCLRAGILTGELRPGDAVPSERTLAEQHGVNRHAVREALKRLQQAGLVRITQGGATRVQDWREHGGLDLLLDLVTESAGPSPAGPPTDVVRSVLELRALIGIDAIRRFVAGAEPADRERVAQLVDAVAVAVESGDGGPGDVPAVSAAYEDVWREIVTGSGNLAYRLMLNSLNQAVGAFPELAAALAPDDPSALRRLGDAVRAGDDAEAAALVAARLQADVPAA